ncbi:MAG TPA: DNA recombination protein RmuC [Acholeplasmataceae bacterium]|nr:DNA recombination protein RmuC [Acholeplasmataceae bacterium]
MRAIDWVFLGIFIVIVVLLIYILITTMKKKDDNSSQENLNLLKGDIINSIKAEYDTLTNIVSKIFNVHSESQERQNKQFSQNVEMLIKQINESQVKANLEIEQKLENIRKSVENSINTLRESIENRLGKVRDTIDTSLNKINEDNAKKLEEMRQTVDEKLQSTLNKRISESFKTVSESLERVTKGLGEMKSLATGVGDLKKVLMNVKTRGTLGEIQLANILEEILIPEQYETNFATKRGSKDRVEFAIKLPGDGDPVYLPIDSKFPLEDYERLLDAYEQADVALIEKVKKDLSNKIKQFAKDISTKYIDVPNTTEFAIMFLPIEGLYAEVVKLGVVEELQRNYKINIAGPTTMAALLNSIQMGFRSLAIQKRSSEVWDTLAKVKTEFEKFGTVLESAQKRINQANQDLDKLVGTRTRQIQRTLKNVAAYTDYTKVLLPGSEEEDDE